MKYFYKGLDISEWVTYLTTNEFSRLKGNSIEDYYYDLWYEKQKLAAAPLSVSISITDLCNLKCSHCSKRQLESCEGNLSFDKFKWVVDKLALEKVNKIILTGGEPLLHDRIRDFIKYVKEKNMKVVILSNLNIDSSSLSQKLNYLDENDVVQVSIDSIGEDYSKIRIGGNFELLSRNCDILCNSSIRTIANMVVTKSNVAVMKNVLEFCESKHFNSIRFTPYFRCSNELSPPDDIQAFTYFIDLLQTYRTNNYQINIQENPLPLLYPYFSYLKSETSLFPYATSYYRCPAAVLSLEIDIQGNVYPCTYLIGKTNPFGNVYTDSIKAIWISEKMNTFRNAVSKAKQCQKCDQLEKCRGGCKAESFIEYNTYDLGDNTCFRRRENGV